LRQIKVGIVGRGWMLRFGQRLLVPGFFENSWTDTQPSWPVRIFLSLGQP
jgi:hypothetical protein